MSIATPTRPVEAPPPMPFLVPEPRIQPGDIILYPAQPGDVIDSLICEGTHGPFSHCGVVERVEVSPGDGAVQVTTIEALSRGVSRVVFPLDAMRGATRIPTFARIAAEMEPLRIAHGLAWAGRQVGRTRYNWYAIAADVVKALLPRTLGSRTPFLVAPSRLDCSELVTKYLLAAGYEWPPDEAIDAPERVSPNDVARLLGALKP